MPRVCWDQHMPRGTGSSSLQIATSAAFNAALSLPAFLIDRGTFWPSRRAPITASTELLLALRYLDELH